MAFFVSGEQSGPLASAYVVRVEFIGGAGRPAALLKA